MQDFRQKFLTAICVLGAVIALISLLAYRSARYDRVLCVGNNAQCVNIETVNTSDKRALGLSFQNNLPAGSGMLFEFERAERVCMWMKDMNFPLDIVWMDGNQKIIKITENISPETYPDAFCGEPARYVLELNAGMAKRMDLSIGQTASF